MDRDLNKRLFDFSILVIKFLKTLENTPENKVIRHQLIKAVTSAGANYEESQAASSRADFRNKIQISLREMRETNYWLRIMETLENKKQNDIKILVQESEELKKILGSISVKVSKKQI
ncbi:MAG: four helix bundle protein [Bacteroidota bacterium]|nr:four helix bundle protein [Bacteroidota bacterium]